METAVPHEWFICTQTVKLVRDRRLMKDLRGHDCGNGRSCLDFRNRGAPGATIYGSDRAEPNETDIHNHELQSKGSECVGRGVRAQPQAGQVEAASGRGAAGGC
eukprot:scaffold112719_cov43-Prasinocladus_malaysianus.AAC.1